VGHQVGWKKTWGIEGPENCTTVREGVLRERVGTSFTRKGGGALEKELKKKGQSKNDIHGWIGGPAGEKVKGPKGGRNTLPRTLEVLTSEGREVKTQSGRGQKQVMEAGAK